jgi:hypothetical protein
MRFVWVGILISFLLSVEAQTGSYGLLSIPDNNFSFGRIMETKGKVSHRFVFKNSGTLPLSVTNVRTTCGCTVPQWSGDIVLPGQEGFIEVVFNPRGFAGPFHKTIQIQSTARNSNMFVTIGGVVIPEHEMEYLPQKVGCLNVKTNRVNLGYIFKGETVNESILIANYTDKSVTLGFNNLHDHISFRAVPEVLSPGEYGQIDIAFNSVNTTEWDIISDEVSLVLNGKETEDVRIIIVGNLREDFRDLTPELKSLSPVAVFENDTINIGHLKGDEPVTCRFKITNRGNSDLIIRAVKSSCGCTAAMPEKNILIPGEYTYIDALFDPEGRNGSFLHAVTVITNDPDNYKKLLFLKGSVNR